MNSLSNRNDDFYAVYLRTVLLGLWSAWCSIFSILKNTSPLALHRAMVFWSSGFKNKTV